MYVELDAYRDLGTRHRSFWRGYCTYGQLGL